LAWRGPRLIRASLPDPVADREAKKYSKAISDFPRSILATKAEPSARIPAAQNQALTFLGKTNDHNERVIDTNRGKGSSQPVATAQ
jgi:hypothetical protein